MEHHKPLLSGKKNNFNYIYIWLFNMFEIIDFRKSSGENIPNLEEYVKEYVSIHPNIDVMVGTDSQTEGGKTKFSTVVAMYDHGDGVQGHGAHCVYRRWSVPK